MSVLILYGSKHGCTENCAKLLQEQIKDATLCNLKKEVPDLTKYDKVIIGAGVYFGMIRKEVKQFVLSNMETLKTKKLGLFICAMRENELAIDEIKVNFGELFDMAVVKDYFGGEFDFNKLGLFERFIVKMVTKAEKKAIDTKGLNSTVSKEKISQFALAMNQA